MLKNKHFWNRNDFSLISTSYGCSFPNLYLLGIHLTADSCLSLGHDSGAAIGMSTQWCVLYNPRQATTLVLKVTALHQ